MWASLASIKVPVGPSSFAEALGDKLSLAFSSFWGLPAFLGQRLLPPLQPAIADQVFSPLLRSDIDFPACLFHV